MYEYTSESGDDMADVKQVYCPHTAVDSAKDGMADWLADLVTGETNGTPVQSTADAGLQAGTNYNLQHYPLFDMSKAENFKP